MANRFAGKTVVIAGAAGGQGRAGAILFAREGANLALCDVNDEGLAETVAAVEADSPGAELLSHQVAVLEDGGHPAPGIDAVFTPGHTPGHFSFVVSEGDSRAVVLGDTVHRPLEISNPELALVADVDPVVARATREALFRRLDADRTILAGAHFPDFTFGRVITSQAGRTVQQLTY